MLCSSIGSNIAGATIRGMFGGSSSCLYSLTKPQFIFVFLTCAFPTSMSMTLSSPGILYRATSFFCPARYARAHACNLTLWFHQTSVWIKILAFVVSSPTPPVPAVRSKRMAAHHRGSKHGICREIHFHHCRKAYSRLYNYQSFLPALQRRGVVRKTEEDDTGTVFQFPYNRFRRQS